MRKPIGFGLAIVSLVIAFGSVACTRDEQTPRPSTTELTGGTIASTSGRSWHDVTRNWPDASRSAVKEMVEKYGPPEELTSSQASWGSHGPWKRSVVSREVVLHDWPTPHEDVLEQVIDYRVPADRFDDLAQFDGSVMAERTKGELSARCGGESANYLALNLSRDIIEGTKTVEGARHVYEASMKASKEGNKPEIMKSLSFAPMPATEAADRDRSIK